MKSERAKRFVDDLSITIEADGNRVISQSTVVGIWDVYMAINIAEQEAEQRMRQKAVEAFKSSCEYKDGCGGIGRDCHPILCEDLRSFIQKLNEI